MPETDAPHISPDEDELLIDGQEEVFSRSEVELGRIEHHTAAGGLRPMQGRASSAPEPS